MKVCFFRQAELAVVEPGGVEGADRFGGLGGGIGGIEFGRIGWLGAGKEQVISFQVERGSAGVIIGELFDLFGSRVDAVEGGAAVGLGDKIEVDGRRRSR